LYCCGVRLPVCGLCCLLTEDVRSLCVGVFCLFVFFVVGGGLCFLVEFFWVGWVMVGCVCVGGVCRVVCWGGLGYVCFCCLVGLIGCFA